jgi:glycosyltransferase involved in cell wall biosynthesis
VDKFISVVIPNYNAGSTIGKCLEALLSSKYDPFEVIVVDDGSSDDSIGTINTFPCKLIQLHKHAGASRARNAGARESAGDILFFIDADCIVAGDTLSLVNKVMGIKKAGVIGGSYTQLPYDSNFFSIFQSVFINYSELKRTEPDYIASHAMAIEKNIFEKSGGFPEEFLPIIEDVELSHRLRRSGHKLHMAPEVLVRHIFNFTFWKSLRNAFRKSRYWTMYSLGNKDVFKDSGTASRELKVNVFSYFLILFFLLLYFSSADRIFLLVPLIIACLNLYVNRNLLKAFYRAKGAFFTIPASLYYTMLYPLAVGAGSFTGMMQYFRNSGLESKQG